MSRENRIITETATYNHLCPCCGISILPLDYCANCGAHINWLKMAFTPNNIGRKKAYQIAVSAIKYALEEKKDVFETLKTFFAVNQ